MAERDLIVLSENPMNAETRLDERTPVITRAGRHYVRTHFPIPDAPRELRIEGAVRAPRGVTVEEVGMLPARTLTVTLECAGNGRRFLEPRVPGEQWGLGAVGTAEWTGASLRSVLENEAFPNAVEVLFRGADEGTPKDLGRRIAYERSLPIEVALGEDVLVAYLMNGEPIPPEHGGPLRLVVPGWYGMASVKWLESITLLDRPFDGFFQKDRYVIAGRPLREIAPRAVITSPQEGATVQRAFWVLGYAWSGAAPVTRVELSRDGGQSWVDVPGPFLESRSRYAWSSFKFELLLNSGILGEQWSLVARATDAAGNVQGLRQNRNELGYMNNAARPVRIRVKS